MLTKSAPRQALSKPTLLFLSVLLLLAVLYTSPAPEPPKAVAIAPAAPEVFSGLGTTQGETETAVFAGGCFWGVQAVFQHTRGVTKVVSGYSGGRSEDANYKRVSSGGTDHAEAVQITFDPRQISFAALLQIYFSVAHDPTQINRQTPDVGKQYRSAVFYANPNQKEISERYIRQLDASGVFGKKIATQVQALQEFFPAENEHQNYATLNPKSPYIVRFDQPKIANLKALYPALYLETPTLLAL